MAAPTFEILEAHCFDALEDLRWRGERFDAVVADPPYCSGACTVAELTRGKGLEKYVDSVETRRDEFPEFPDAMSQRAFILFSAEWIRRCRELLRSPGYLFIFIDWRQLPCIADALQIANCIWRGVAVWDKRNARPNKGQISQTCEFVVWGTKDAAKSDKHVHGAVISEPSPPVEDRIHPTQKSVAVISRLLEVLPDEARSVLDPFSGSASTGIAALSRGLNFTGIEANPVYAENSRGRLSESLHALELTGQFIDKKRGGKEPTLF